MPPINLQPFLGYSTKPDGVLDDPRIASDCNNVIIHNGDICNFPFNKKYYDGNRFLEAQTHILGMYSDNKTKKSYLVYFDGRGGLYITSISASGTLLNFVLLNAQFNLIAGVDLRAPFSTGGAPFENNSRVDTLIKAMSSNFIQVGDWLYFLGVYSKLGVVDPTELVDGVESIGKYLPRRTMMRIAVQKIGTNPEQIFVDQIGTHSSYRVEVVNSGSGTLTANVDFAVTLVREFGVAANVQPTKLSVVARESSATVIGTLTNFVNGSALFTIYFPLGEYPLPGFRYGIYARLDNQSIYYLVRYTEEQLITATFDTTYGAWKQEFTLNLNAVTVAASQEAFRFTPAPLTGVVPIVGAHDVPRLCYHGAFFKNRMYYTCSSRPKNLLQYSARTPVTDVETGQFAQYIEGVEQVGDEKEGLAGLIVFQGQLIIFRETSTWVLTDDITTTGSLRGLLSDVGCVNIDGGQGYIVINNVLYFVSSDGVIQYDGGTQENISDIIQEDLLKISRLRYSYVRLRHDSRYNLLIMCFPLGKGCNPTEVVPTFVYAYDSKQWTKTDHLDDVIIDKRSTDDPAQQVNVWVARKERLALLGLITEQEEFDTLNINWFWKSSLLDLGYGELMKSWQQMHIEQIPDDYRINLTLVDGKGNTVGDPLINQGNKPLSKLRNLGAHSKTLSVQLSNSELTRKPFRINRAKIQALLTGVQ